MTLYDRISHSTTRLIASRKSSLTRCAIHAEFAPTVNSAQRQVQLVSAVWDKKQTFFKKDEPRSRLGFAASGAMACRPVRVSRTHRRKAVV